MYKLVIAALAIFLAAGNTFAQMGAGQMGGGTMGGNMGGGTIGGNMGGGIGYGMAGAGGMASQMMGNTVSHGYLQTLNPITNAEQARAAIQSFIDESGSSLEIAELWEYGTVYMAELSDLNGAMAFDVIADKLTGAVGPEMGLSMMMNASYGKNIYKTAKFGKKLTVSEDQATATAQDFVNTNGLGYKLGTPEDYPGYYKFHTTDSHGFGLEIMVNGYNGAIWMNSLLGRPLANH
ncbi:MAG TPA: hypothetical protein VGA09_10650 [Candidatus Binatia bacterium]